MPEHQTDAFLSGTGISVDPTAIEQTLSELWSSSAQAAGAPDVDNAPVTRVVLANLIVETTPERWHRVAETLDAIVSRFPCRTIVALRTPTPGRHLGAEVSAFCHLPTPGEPQVCSERILLNAGAEAVDLLPGAIRPLLESDLPVVLWWTSDPRRAEPLFRDLAEEATRVVLDLDESDNHALGFGLDPSINPYTRDTAWFALTPWRDLIAQCFDGPACLPMLGRIRHIAILATSPKPQTVPTRPAAWLAAWFAGQLGWKMQRPTRTDGRLQTLFDSASGSVRVEIRVEHDPAADEPRVVEVFLEAECDEGASTFHLQRTPRNAIGVRVSNCSPHACELPRWIEVPISDAAHRLSAALESSRIDPPFQRARPIALRLLQPETDESGD